jgi:hypothetical protein
MQLALLDRDCGLMTETLRRGVELALKSGFRGSGGSAV